MKRKHVVVVGGSSSFGKVLISNLKNLDYDITSTFFMNKPDFFSNNIKFEYLDITNKNSQAIFAADLSPIDVLILLPSILPGLQLSMYDDDLSDSVMGINFTYQANLIRRLLSKFAENSQILIMSSISGQKGSFDPIYAASKSALFGFGKSIAIWLAPRTRTNIIAPSLIAESSMYDQMEIETRQTHIDMSPVKRLLTSQELASVMVDLLKPSWRHLNGSIIGLNGGSYL